MRHSFVFTRVAAIGACGLHSGTRTTASMRNLILLLFFAHGASASEDFVSKGAALENERKWDEAAAVYQAALDRCTDRCSWLLTSLGEMAFNRGEYREARRWFDRAKDTGGVGSGRLLGASGALHVVEGRLKEAERDLIAAIRLNEDLESVAVALHNLASVEMQTGRLAAAEQHELEAIALCRGALGDRHEYVRRGWISLSTVQGLRRDWKAAERSLRNALAIARTADALANYAVILEHSKRGKEAREIRRRLPAVPRPSATVDATALKYEEEAMRVVAQ